MKNKVLPMIVSIRIPAYTRSVKFEDGLYSNLLVEYWGMLDLLSFVDFAQ